MPDESAAAPEQAHDPSRRTVERSTTIEARPATVWGILSRPEKFSRWVDGDAAFELQIGSPFRVEFPKYEAAVTGEVVAIDAQVMHLAVTWGTDSDLYAGLMPVGSTLADFRVRETRDGCRVDIRHGGFSSDPMMFQLDSGWRFHLGRLALMANRSDLTAGLKRTLPRWFDAWNEPKDAEARLAALRACCFEEVEFRDEWAVARGVESLNVHIANCHRFMPGWRIEAAGEPRICRGEALVSWRSTGPGGPVEGVNHLRAAHDGRLRRVAGFSG